MMKSEPYWEPLQPISNFPAVPLSEPESDIFLSLKDAAWKCASSPYLNNYHTSSLSVTAGF